MQVLRSRNLQIAKESLRHIAMATAVVFVAGSSAHADIKIGSPVTGPLETIQVTSTKAPATQATPSKAATKQASTTSQATKRPSAATVDNAEKAKSADPKPADSTTTNNTKKTDTDNSKTTEKTTTEAKTDAASDKTKCGCETHTAPKHTHSRKSEKIVSRGSEESGFVSQDDQEYCSPETYNEYRRDQNFLKWFAQNCQQGSSYGYDQPYGNQYQQTPDNVNVNVNAYASNPYGQQGGYYGNVGYPPYYGNGYGNGYGTGSYNNYQQYSYSNYYYGGQSQGGGHRHKKKDDDDHKSRGQPNSHQNQNLPWNNGSFAFRSNLPWISQHEVRAPWESMGRFSRPVNTLPWISAHGFGRPQMEFHQPRMAPFVQVRRFDPPHQEMQGGGPRPSFSAPRQAPHPIEFRRR